MIFKIITYINIFICFFLYNSYIGNAQTNYSKISIAITGGFTYHKDKPIYIADLQPDKQLKFGYFDINLNYKITNTHTIKLTLGRNYFTQPQKFLTGYYFSTQIQPADTTFIYTDAFYLKNYWFLTFGYKYIFQNNWFLNGDLGSLINNSPYVVLSAGKSISLKKMISLELGAAYSCRLRFSGKIINSQQVVLKLGLQIKL